MLTRPYIRQGKALATELKISTRSWGDLHKFLDDLHENGTPQEIEPRRANYTRRRDEIDAAAHGIYNGLETDQRKQLSQDEDLIYPGLAQYNLSQVLSFIHLDQAETLAVFSMFWESTRPFPAIFTHHTECWTQIVPLWEM